MLTAVADSIFRGKTTTINFLKLSIGMNVDLQRE